MIYLVRLNNMIAEEFWTVSLGYKLENVIKTDTLGMTGDQLNSSIQSCSMNLIGSDSLGFLVP